MSRGSRSGGQNSKLEKWECYLPLFWDIDFNSLARLQGNSVKILLGWSWEAWKKDNPVLNEMIILEPMWQTAETVISMAERSGQARGDMLCLFGKPTQRQYFVGGEVGTSWMAMHSSTRGLSQSFWEFWNWEWSLKVVPSGSNEAGPLHSSQ